MKQLLAMLMMVGMLAACASSEPEVVAEPEKPAAKQEKQTCAVDTDCTTGYGMCVKPEAADYGFCL